MRARSAKRFAALAAVGLASLGVGSGLASAAKPPSSGQLRAVGSSSKAARTQPRPGLRAVPGNQPLIAVAFAGGRATVLGGSAVGPARDVRSSNLPISYTQCFVNFTTGTTRTSTGKAVRVRWFSGIGCSRPVELFGQAWLAESARKFDGTGNFYKGVMKSASSGQANTIVNATNPSLYVWSATNVYFQEHPARGLIVISPSPGQQINPSTACKVVTSPSFGFGVHCDLYTQRF